MKSSLRPLPAQIFCDFYAHIYNLFLFSFFYPTPAPESLRPILPVTFDFTKGLLGKHILLTVPQRKIWAELARTPWVWWAQQTSEIVGDG